MLFILNQFQLYNLETLDWNKPFDEQGIDSLEATAVITSIEHEFHTIFEDNVFDNLECLNDVKKQLTSDHNAF
jgi:acyl carrier protein